jgi:hypothetical protein
LSVSKPFLLPLGVKGKGWASTRSARTALDGLQNFEKTGGGSRLSAGAGFERT